MHTVHAAFSTSLRITVVQKAAYFSLLARAAPIRNAMRRNGMLAVYLVVGY